MRDDFAGRRAARIRPSLHPSRLALPHALLGFLLIFLAACDEPQSRRESEPARTQPAFLLVSAASDLTIAFQEIGAAFEDSTGTRVQFNFGASGELAEQIRRGAPADVYASADIAYVDELIESGRLVDTTKRVYARGALVVWTRRNASIRVDSLRDLLQPEIRRVSIANPRYAPYGRAAREALARSGLWDAIHAKIVIAQTVRQAHQYAETGSADAALIAHSLAARSDGVWVQLADSLYRPLMQAIAVVNGSAKDERARAFVEFVMSAEGQRILRANGFFTPVTEAAP